MKRRTSAPADQPDPGQGDEDRTATRRALLTRGGVVAAGVVGAGVAGAAVAGRANAAPGDPVLQGTVNSVGTNVAATEISATNSTAATPTVVLTNLGSTASGETSPSLRLTPAAAGLVNPSSATVGGDLAATNDGELWFTHEIPQPSPNPPVIAPAIVHTEANSNTFVPLATPFRILDTRTTAGRAHVIDPSGKFSGGKLLGGKTIHVNLSSLVFFADAMTANLTVLVPAAGGWLVLWSGVGSRPNASSINYAKGAALSNLTVSALAFNTTTFVSSIGIFTTATTAVTLDVIGFSAPGFEFVNTAASGIASAPRAARIRAAKAAIARRGN
jgi:hypothetical protein